MAQHDYVINNDTAPNVRSDINLALAAIASNNSGATEPDTTYANMFWYDTATDVMKQRNENNSAWVTLELTPTTPVSLTQAQAEDDASTVFGNVSGQRLGQAIAASAVPIPVKAWVNFNGIGMVAIRASGNVSSITDNGVGSYVVNFTTNLANINYAAHVSCQTPTNTNAMIASIHNSNNSSTAVTAAPLVGSMVVAISDRTNALRDSAFVSVTVLGN